MIELARYGSDVGSVFSLLGHKENDLTAALGFVFGRCPGLLSAVLQRVLPAGTAPHIEDVALGLEVRDDDAGGVGHEELDEFEAET